ncbi:MAG: M23 family metallopeptidase [Thermodesulfobacteriota bacterium]
MASAGENVTIVWRSRTTGARSRLSLSRRAVLFFGGACLAAAACAAVLGAVTVRLYRDNGVLYARLADGEEVARRLAAAETEMAAARQALAQVRAEEARIRQWLGLEDEETATREAEAPERAEGGQGSLGDVDLEAVSPEDLAGAGAAEGALEASLGLAARSLALDLADLSTRLHERKRHWDAIPALAPVEGEHWVSSAFGWRKSPFTGKREFHSGVDLAGARGLPVVAAADGLVIRAVSDAALGKAVTLDHGNGIETLYGHLDRLSVKEGERVRRGQKIGKLGSTGKRSTGPHLHYAVRVDGKYVNPKNFLSERGTFPYPVANR